MNLIRCDNVALYITSECICSVRFENDMYISEINKLKKRISVMEAKLRGRRKRK